MLKRSIGYFIYLFIIIEIFLQTVAYFSLIPKGFSKSEHIPYGRVYWSKEGFSNGMMNRYGWYYPEFRLEADSKKVAIIGDSYVEALQIDPSEHMGLQIESMLNKNKTDDNYEVLALGKSGVAAAYYYEIMKYAIKHYQPDEFIFSIYLGNDFKDTSLEKKTSRKPNKYIFYQLDDNGEIVMHPESVKAQQKYQARIEANHEPVYKHIPAILKSHLMTIQVFRDVLRKVRMTLGLKERDPEFNPEDVMNNVTEEMQRVGLDDFVFVKDRPQAAIDATTIMYQLLLKAKALAEANGATLKLATIPTFPSIFFKRNPERGWTSEIDNHDFFLPEKELIKFAKKNDIDILPLGRYLQDNDFSKTEIMSLYNMGDILHYSMHLSAKGHEVMAKAIVEELY